MAAAEHEAAVADVKRHMEHFVLHPASWQRYSSSTPLVWKQVDFGKVNRSRVPKRPGLYAFAVQPPHTDFPPSSWLFYVGEVGATGSEKRTLWQRYKEYLDELGESVRAKVGTFIYRYRGYVRFYFCELDPVANDLKAIESALISALWPDGNINDSTPTWRGSGGRSREEAYPPPGSLRTDGRLAVLHDRDEARRCRRVDRLRERCE